MDLKNTKAFKTLIEELKGFVALFNNSDPQISLNDLNQKIHQFKGSLGFFGFDKLAGMFKEFENIDSEEDRQTFLPKIFEEIEKIIKNQ